MSQYTAMPDASAPPVYESVAPPGGVNPQQPAPQQNTAAPVVVVGANANPNAVLKQFAGVQPQPQPQATYAVLPQQPVVYYQQQPQQPLGAAPQQPAMSRDGQPAAAAAAAGAGAAATQYPGAYQYQPPQPQYAGQPLAQPMPHYVPGQPPQQYPGAAAYPGQPQMMGGGAGGAAVGGAAQTQGAQTVIYASGAPLPMYFTHQSQLVICPVCRAQAPTVVEYEPGLGTWAICCGLACVGCWVGCCLIPFCVPECQDATHRCPHCKNVVGRKALIS